LNQEHISGFTVCISPHTYRLEFEQFLQNSKDKLIAITTDETNTSHGLPLAEERPTTSFKTETTEQIKQLKEERFYQRVQLSKYTQDLVAELTRLLDQLYDVSHATKIETLTTHTSPSHDVNSSELEIVTRTVEKLRKLAQLFTQQPESVLMALRFDFQLLLPKLEKELKRIIPESEICETTMTIPGTDLSVQYKRAASVCHVLMGHAYPPKGRSGVRILTMDGGGSKGLVTLEILKRFEEEAGRPIHELFDYIGGTSTGAILAFLVGVQKRPLHEVETIYTDMSTEIWGKTNLWQGGTRLLRSHAYYDTRKFEEILSDMCGDMALLESGIDRDCPRFSCISTLVNRSRSKPYR
jgi:hypothetical protein